MLDLVENTNLFLWEMYLKTALNFLATLIFMSYSELLAFCPQMSLPFLSAGKATVFLRKQPWVSFSKWTRVWLCLCRAVVLSEAQMTLSWKMFNVDFYSSVPSRAMGKSLKMFLWNVCVNLSAWISRKMCHQITQPKTVAGSYLIKTNNSQNLPLIMLILKNG